VSPQHMQAGSYEGKEALSVLAESWGTCASIPTAAFQLVHTKHTP
jgi:hypothetical protein